jgi:hypothetical protein
VTAGSTARRLSAQGFTEKQGPCLAFIYTYSHMFRRPPRPANATCQRQFHQPRRDRHYSNRRTLLVA